MACFEEAAGGRQHYPRSIVAKVTRVEPSRKYLAVHPRQLALEPGFQILRRHPRSLLLRLEHAYDGIYRISFAPCAMWGGRGRRTFVGGDVTALGMVAPGLALRELSCSEP